MSHLTSNLLGRCPLGRKNCPYRDSYCSDCIKQERRRKKDGAEKLLFNGLVYELLNDGDFLKNYSSFEIVGATFCFNTVAVSIADPFAEFKRQK